MNHYESCGVCHSHPCVCEIGNLGVALCNATREKPKPTPGMKPDLEMQMILAMEENEKERAMNKCVVYGCGRPALDWFLCEECFAYLRYGHGMHETLVRPGWELVPALKMIHRTLINPQLRDVGLESLAALIRNLERKDLTKEVTNEDAKSTLP